VPVTGTIDGVPDEPDAVDQVPRDTGLRKLLTWTFIALLITLAMAVIAVNLVIYFFDRS
jgi:hypothetical protein